MTTSSFWSRDGWVRLFVAVLTVFSVVSAVTPPAAAQVAEPHVAADPDAAPVDALVAVTGSGFVGDCAVNLRLRNAFGQEHELGQAAVAGDGTFAQDVRIPLDTPEGGYDLVAAGVGFGLEFCGTQESGRSAQTPFRVVPRTTEYDYTIRLRNRVVEPHAGGYDEMLSEMRATGDDTHALVQLYALPSTRSEDLEDLEERGITFLGYLGGMEGLGTTYLTTISPEVDDDERFWELVRAVVRLRPEDVLASDLQFVVENPAGDAMDVLVRFFDDVTSGDAAEALASHGVAARERGQRSGFFEATATPQQIADLAAHDLVQFIQRGPFEIRPEMTEVRAALNVDEVQDLDTATGSYAGRSGDGVDIGIMDTGVDTAHDDFAGRMIRSDDDTAATGHGSHVAGIAAGSGSRSNQNDDAGNPNGGTAFQHRGIAPEADVAAFRSFAGDASKFADAINNFGVDVSNHSYAVQADGIYDSEIASIDAIIRGDSPGVPARPAVYSAGNSGLSSQYGMSPGYFGLSKSCKSCIAVANVDDNLVHNPTSSLGPTPDGRLKPEVAAIGTNVTSVQADHIGSGNGYLTTGGTSMASPAVAGTIALMLEQYADTLGVNLDTAPPLPSTSRAILVQTAVDLEGTDGTNNPDTGAPVQYGAGPDWATGYGLVDAAAAVQVVAEGGYVEDELDGGDHTDTHNVAVAAGQRTVRVTVAWDDLAGTPNANDATPQLVNDLDLVLVDPNGVEHLPLVLPPLAQNDCDNDATNGVQVGTCAGIEDANQNFAGPAAPGVDRLNSLEQVVVTDPGGLVAGTWTARVSVRNDDATVRLPLGGTQSYSLAFGMVEPEADLTVELADDPDPVPAGEEVTYTATVANDGPDTAVAAQLVDELPARTTFVSSSGTCSEAPAGTVTCTLGDLAPGASTTVDITARVDADLVYDNGGPATITNTASVASDTTDPDPADNTAKEDTAVVAEADAAIVDMAVADAPAELLVGETAVVTVRTTVTNHGPSSPVDAVLEVTGDGGPNSVTPASRTSDVTALEDENRVIASQFVVSCDQGGVASFLFAGSLALADSADTDPDGSNNADSVTFDVGCVVPVAINIKPGSTDNPVNLGNSTVPVALLTTTAGEYGLPSDVSASDIAFATVRFGDRQQVWSGTGGAAHRHKAAHFSDQLERDERTRDGDIDMKLQFRANESGLAGDDTEACVRGRFSNGVAFFGCDVVRIVP